MAQSFLAARRAYGEFEQRAGQLKAPRGAKSALVLDAIERQPGDFSVAGLHRECTGVSLDMIRHLLDQQRKAKKSNASAPAAVRAGGKLETR